VVWMTVPQGRDSEHRAHCAAGLRWFDTFPTHLTLPLPHHRLLPCTHITTHSRAAFHTRTAPGNAAYAVQLVGASPLCGAPHHTFTTIPLIRGTNQGGLVLNHVIDGSART